MSQEAVVKELLAEYRLRFLGNYNQVQGAPFSLQDDFRFEMEAGRTLARINQLVNQSLRSKRAELKGVTIGESTRGRTRATFDGSDFGLSIVNPSGVFQYVETAVVQRYEAKDDPDAYHLTYLNCIAYPDVGRFSDENELVDELNRLQKFFGNRTTEDIMLEEDRFNTERHKTHASPPRGKGSPSRRRHNSSNQRRQRAKAQRI
ncbi:MAG: hypothetical protein Hyperionvirus1_143 [Hyperionvirus sp.]|uniref:Uncharacterized protein n=1 Tax=Hyperionvirus sp. TaxID=2487770 RepID=A0A3G5A7T1_9VIRU|nr:MAG: hypothetical protein Hyperionvirus1_143 [Hyperionvirus sp.]